MTSKNFDPNKLASDIPDDVREAHANDQELHSQEKTDAFIRDCNARGDDGKISLLASASVTLAVNIHQYVRRVLSKGNDKDYIKQLDDMIRATDNGDIVVCAAFLAYGKMIVSDYLDNALKEGQRDPIKALSMMSNAKIFADGSMALADRIVPSLKKAVNALIDNDINGLKKHMDVEVLKENPNTPPHTKPGHGPLH